MSGQAAFDVSGLRNLLNDATNAVKGKIDGIKSRGSAISIGDMLDVQLTMNKLSQMSEMTTSVVSAANTSISSMARNVKG